MVMTRRDVTTQRPLVMTRRDVTTQRPHGDDSSLCDDTETTGDDSS